MFRKRKEVKFVFHKHLLLFLITILIPTLLLLSFQVYRIQHDAREQLENASHTYLDRSSRNLDILLDQMNQMVLQISLSPSVLDLLKHPFDQTAYDYAQTKEQLRSWTVINPLFHSLYLDILQNRKVLTTNEGIYDEADFYDIAFLQGLNTVNTNKSSSWIGLRSLPSEDGRGILTFARSVPPVQSTPLGVLVLNVQKDIFYNTWMNLQKEQAGPMILLDPEGRMISGPIQGLDAEKIADSLQAGTVKSDRRTIGDADFLVSAYKLPASGFVIIQLSPFAAYDKQVAAAFKQAALILLVVTAAGVGVSYYFAFMLYTPWKRLADRLKGFVFTGESRDPYTFVNYAIHDLLAVIRKNEPIVRYQLVHELLHDHRVESSDITIRFREAGIQFVYPNFVVLVMIDESLDHQGKIANQLLYLYSLAEDTFGLGIPSAGTILDRQKIGFIVNVEYEEMDEFQMARLEDVCRSIQQLARERIDATVSFCISSVYPLDQLHEGFEQVKRMIAYKAFMETDIYFSKPMDENVHYQYPAVYQKLIMNAILSTDRDAAESYITEMFDRYLENSVYPYPKLLQTILVLMSHVISSLVQEGFDIGPLMNEIDLLQLQHCQNRDELRQLLVSQTDHVILYLETLRRRDDDYGAIVHQAIAFIENHYAENISISDVASSLGISASYLSRLFKAEVGKRPQEYLTEYRLKISKTLLKDHRKTLQQIIEQIGYNDVHTYIRSFKKFEGTTPGEYRKRSMDHS
ncbi:AraC family transcriptional regulator [Paenibacillus favisporus]|uniref:AraC family transcriptional regulator n=1 Tax=Paenibacillus favisporus TaxID=221028 RepID=UPI003D2919AD